VVNISGDNIVFDDRTTSTGFTVSGSSNELSGQSITMPNGTDVSLMGFAQTQGAVLK